MVLIFQLLACIGEVVPTDGDMVIEVSPAFVSDPVAERPSELVGGVRRLIVRTDVPTTVVAEIADPTGARQVTSDTLQIEHELVLVGFRADVDTEVGVVATDEDGDTAVTAITVTGDTLPLIRPRIDALTHDVERTPAGWWLLPTSSPEFLGAEGIDLLLDAELEVVWWRKTDRPLGDLRVTPRGTLSGQGAVIEELSWTGETVVRYTPGEPGRDEVQIESGLIHHDALPLDDGSWLALAHSIVEVPRYPVSLEPPDPVEGPVEVLSTQVTHIAADGRTLESVELLDHIDAERVSFGSLTESLLYEAPDHSHANAVVIDDSGGWVVSMRHQDALLKFDAQRQLVWILGDPAGWRDPWSQLLLEPIGDLTWPYHQHAPELGPDGTMLLFDNTNRDHTPYDAEPAFDAPSRLVEFRIDEALGTVEELWSFVAERDGPLHSEAMGDADRLPSGEIMGVWGLLRSEGGVDNSSVGLGTFSARLLVVDPSDDDAVRLDLRLGSTSQARGAGWGMYRAEFLTSLPR